MTSGPSVLRARITTVGEVVKRRGELFGRITPSDLVRFVGNDTVNANDRAEPPTQSCPGFAAAQFTTVMVGADMLGGQPQRRGVTDYSRSPPLASVRRDVFPAELLAVRHCTDCPIVVMEETEGREGVEIAARLAAHPYYASTPIYLLSGGACKLERDVSVRKRSTYKQGLRMPALC